MKKKTKNLIDLQCLTLHNAQIKELSVFDCDVGIFPLSHVELVRVFGDPPESISKPFVLSELQPLPRWIQAYLK